MTINDLFDSLKQVVLTDNHGMAGESAGHVLCLDNGKGVLPFLLSEEHARRLQSLLNEDVTDLSPHWYKVVNSDYKPLVWEP